MWAVGWQHFIIYAVLPDVYHNKDLCNHAGLKTLSRALQKVTPQQPHYMDLILARILPPICSLGQIYGATILFNSAMSGAKMADRKTSVLSILQGDGTTEDYDALGVFLIVSGTMVRD